MIKYKDPFIIDLLKIGESSIGYISVIENSNMPFNIKRIFWTYYTPESIVRGRHAHYNTEQILIAATGKIIVNTETATGETKTFKLDSPNLGVYIPPNVWHTMQYSHTAIQMALASTEFDESDYIRDFDVFKTFWAEK